MKHPTRILQLLCASALLATAPAWAQQAPEATQSPATPSSREVPRPDQLEPGVDTSATPPSSPASEPVAPRESAPNAAAPPPSQAKGTSKAASPTELGAASKASTDAKSSTAKGTQASSSTQPKVAAGKAQDRIELDTTDITGNRELPKVLYIVPWKRSDLGDLVGRPANSLLDEVLAPVDRDVFKRQNRYYDALKPDVPTQAAGAAAPAPAPGGTPEGGGKP